MTDFRELEEKVRKSSEEFDDFYEKLRIEAAKKMADKMDQDIRNIINKGKSESK